MHRLYVAYLRHQNHTQTRRIGRAARMEHAKQESHGRRGKLNNGAESDAFTRWRQFINWQPGELKAIKRRYNRRHRRETRQQLHKETT